MIHVIAISLVKLAEDIELDAVSSHLKPYLTPAPLCKALVVWPGMLFQSISGYLSYGKHQPSHLPMIYHTMVTYITD